MIDNKTFNQKISEIENLNNSDASKAIKFIKKFNFQNSDFCDFFDNFCYKIGIGFENLPLYKEETDKLIGYIPRLKYYPENIFNETEDYVDLSNETLDIKTSSKLLAKETLYRMMRVNNFEQLVEEKFKS